MKNKNTPIEKRNTIVLLLAGGVGSRLNILVQNRAKPAVPFAGIYRIIDFSLSNAMNSGLKQVGILTQYKPLSLMRHMGTGEAWDFTGRTRGVKILPPRTGFKDSDWYKGTADAVRQNIDFILSNSPSEVLILSGDHIYEMDYDKMINFHRDKKADITIAMMEVDMDQIHQFGTGITNEEGRIIEWEEKPEKPRTNLASMGVYVFDTDYLLELLQGNREVDFGMHLIPAAIEEDNVYAFPFKGYWRDVGTVQAYWEANMDVLRSDSGISPQKWAVRSNPEAEGRVSDWSPARFESGCKITNSLISAGCRIEGEVENSVLSPGVVVKEGAVVKDSIIFNDTVIESGACVDLAIIDKRAVIGGRAVIGCGAEKDIPNRQYPKHLYTGITLIGQKAKVPADTRIGRNCIVQSEGRIEAGGVTIGSGETV